MKPCNFGDFKTAFNGRCCCNCKHQRPISAHPWNTGGTKGPITKIIGYGCTVPDMPAITFFTGEHSLCEMWEERLNA